LLKKPSEGDRIRERRLQDMLGYVPPRALMQRSGAWPFVRVERREILLDSVPCADRIAKTEGRIEACSIRLLRPNHGRYSRDKQRGQ
jgi:hypothetical protein